MAVIERTRVTGLAIGGNNPTQELMRGFWGFDKPRSEYLR